MKIVTKNFTISESSPTYFIADIAANHDGDLDRAIELIHLAAESGANAAKFQNFRAETIVSDKGFKDLGEKMTHQVTWKDSVFDTYKNAELPVAWTAQLIKACDDAKIDYFTAPYDLEFIEFFSDKMELYKVGSGDITWRKSLVEIGKKQKPVLLATGASEFSEVERAVKLLETFHIPIVLMQCNTNYTGDPENINHLNLRVLKQYSARFPNCILGLSDHSPGHLSVIGAVALGAKVIEKHFTDDTKREGPDHGFSLDPKTWSTMVSSTRLIEGALGSGLKVTEINEEQARIVQRRSLRYRKDLKSGHQITELDLIALRPAPIGSLDPFEDENFIGRTLTRDVEGHALVAREHVY
jgi:N-acetylneuraminate synthase